MKTTTLSMFAGFLALSLAACADVGDGAPTGSAGEGLTFEQALTETGLSEAEILDSVDGSVLERGNAIGGALLHGDPSDSGVAATTPAPGGSGYTNYCWQ